MRALNENEKTIIEKLVNAKNLREHAIIKLIDEYVNVCAIVWDKQYSKISIYNKDNLYSLENSYNELLELIFLLEYLRSNMYISIYNMTGEKIYSIYDRQKYKLDESEELITMIEERNPNGNTGIITPSCLMIHTDIGKTISLYAKSAFYVSESLKDFVKNGFKSEEQLIFEKQMDDTQKKHAEAMKINKRTLSWTRLAFFAAFFTIMADGVVSLFELYSEKDMTIRELNNTIKEKDLPEVINTKLINDTIKSFVINQPNNTGSILEKQQPTKK